jgi:hypothetical protein
MKSPAPSNPFPSDAVVKNSIDQLPDFRETNSYQRAVALVENFRENFSLVGSGGMAMGVRGRFGSGKTHLIFQLIQELQTSKRLQSIPMYAKADKADFLDFYVNHFAGKLDVDVLKKAVSLHLAKLLRANNTPPAGPVSDAGATVALGDLMLSPSSGEKTLPEIAQEEVDKLVATNPASILDLVQQDLLPVSGLSGQLARELEMTGRNDSGGEGSQSSTEGVANVSRDFFRAYSKVTDKNLSPLAVRWLQGGTLSNSERLDLGLQSSGITQASAAKQALRFLLGAFKKADFAVMFCVDEFERFSSRGTADDLNASAGLLKDLAETFQDTGHLLVVSGENGAWSAMKKDVFARIKPADIIEMTLSAEEASGLLDAYCRGSNTSVDSVFGSETFQLLYEASNHNTRRVLELAHEAYEVATGSGSDQADGSSVLPVKDQHVEQAANNLLSGSKRREAVEQAIQAVALNMGLPVHKDFKRNGTTCDYALGDGQSPQVAIEVTKSIFKLSELDSAREIASASQTFHRDYPQLRFCVVIVGYSTKEVRDELAKVVDRVFAFDEDSFPLEFREFLRDSALQPREVEQRLKSQEAAYQELLQKFDQLEGARRDELEQLKQALESLQSQSTRVHETEREKRVTDKMGETLEQLNDLLQQEEEFAFRSFSPEGKSKDGKDEGFIQPREKLARVMRLLDEQRAHVRRADILNEKLPQAEEFASRLEHLNYLMQDTADIWEQAPRFQRDPSSLFLDELPAARDLYRGRKEIISELEGLHYRRASTESTLLGKIGQRISQHKLTLALSFVSVLGIIVLLYSLYSGWSNEKSAIAYYSAQVSMIQGQIRLMELDPNNIYSHGDITAQTLLQYTVSLEAFPPGKTYVVPTVLASGVPTMRSQLLLLRNELVPRPAPSPTPAPSSSFDPGLAAKPSPTPSAGPATGRSPLQVRLEAIDGLCSELGQGLGAISFSTFAWKYMVANFTWVLFEVLPLIVLIFYLTARGVRNRLLRLS